MGETQALPLLLALLLSPSLLHINCRHVGTAKETPALARGTRSLRDKYKDLFKVIETERYSDDNVEVETTFITACVGLEAEVKALKGRVEEVKAQNKDLDNKNFDLKKKLRDEQERNRQTGYEALLRVAEMQLKVSGWIDQMGPKTVKISKLTLQVMSKYLDYKNLEMKIGKTEDSSKLSAMRKELEQKKRELTQAEQELMASGRASNLVIQIVTLQKKIHELESKGSDDESILKQIADLKKELEEKTAELTSSGGSDVSTVLIIQIVTLQKKIHELESKGSDDESILKQIADLKKELVEKTAELTSSGGSDVSTVLIPQIVASQDDILELYNKIKTLKTQSKDKIAG
ncbi:cingulin-like protein 1 [Engraulis encrasicolus]|uniref:cingulin-like protein 1 n=1 Tax=Engraulis encrasicolus TaxID=184585 RepID=UPI002FD77210